ncbi:MAG: cysteine dioxygenase family protein [Planctomycetes bacterium]|nr:cysteine dioxygenase family protein [Planctomycetota bacterium]
MPKLSWSDFLARVEAFPTTSIPVAELFRLVRSVEFPRELLESHMQWSPETYQRVPLYRSDRLEALVLCWEDGQATVIHDHGPSCSVAAVTQGLVKVENFRRADRGERPGFARLETTETLTLNPGDVCCSEIGGIHAMGNEQGGRKRLVTVNFYSPPLSRIQTFDRATGAIGEKVYPALLATL